MFSHAITSNVCLLSASLRALIPSAINGAMNFKILGPIAVVTKSVVLIASTTFSGCSPLLIPSTFSTWIFFWPGAANSISYSPRWFKALMIVSFTSTKSIPKPFAAKVSPINPRPILPAPKCTALIIFQLPSIN